MMRYRNFFGIVFTIFAIVFVSCSSTQSCLEASARLNFVSFPDAATDSMILKKFIKNSGFTSLVDSVIITKTNSIYQKSNDTLYIATPEQGDYVININYDYEVYLPLTQEIFKISDIAQKLTERKVGISLDKTVCVNPIESYKVNGNTINSSLPDFSVIYVKY